MSDGSPELISVHEQADDQSVHPQLAMANFLQPDMD